MPSKPLASSLRRYRSVSVIRSIGGLPGAEAGPKRSGAQQPWQMPLPPRRLRSSARSRLFCWRVVSGESVPPVDGPMLPVVPDTPSPGCGRPSSEPVRARGMVLPAVTSLVEGEIEPDGAAAAPGAGPAPAGAEPAGPGPAEPAAPAAPPAVAPEGAPAPVPP